MDLAQLKANEDFESHFNKRDQLHLQQGCVIWGYRILIPRSLQHRVLKGIHLTHMGISKCKARSYVWWPNIDVDIERMCSECTTCNKVRSSPPKVELLSFLLYNN